MKNKERLPQQGEGKSKNPAVLNPTLQLEKPVGYWTEKIGNEERKALFDGLGALDYRQKYAYIHRKVTFHQLPGDTARSLEIDDIELIPQYIPEEGVRYYVERSRTLEEAVSSAENQLITILYEQSEMPQQSDVEKHVRLSHTFKSVLEILVDQQIVPRADAKPENEGWREQNKAFADWLLAH